MFTKLDNFIIERFETTIQFLNDWMGITQSFLEKATIGAYVCTTVITFAVMAITPPAKHVSKTFSWFVTAMVLFTFIAQFFDLLKQHRSPKVMRIIRRFRERPRRIGWIFWTVWNCVLEVRGNDSYLTWIVSIGVIVFFALIAAMSYETVCNIEGDRGRKAKLAWDKVKELFGTQWLPVPVRQQ